MTTRRRWRLTKALGGLAWLASAAGCSSSVLTGRVVVGAASEMTLVDAGDQRLEGRPVPGVLVAVRQGGDKGPGKLVGSGVSDRLGRFAINLEHVGGRFLEQPWAITASRSGYLTATTTRRLPETETVLLVSLAPQSAPEKGGRPP